MVAGSRFCVINHAYQLYQKNQTQNWYHDLIPHQFRIGDILPTKQVIYSEVFDDRRTENKNESH
jgi:hypothetical protein